MSWTLVTAPDERHRCMVETDGTRCERPTAWLVGDPRGDAYAFVCEAHVELVSGLGVVERVEDHRS